MIYEKQLALFRERFGELADLVNESEYKSLVISSNRAGQANLVDQASHPPFYYHSSYDVQKEQAQWFDGLSLEGVDVLYIYGLGLGYSYPFLKQWVDQGEDRYIAYIERDPRVLARFLEGKRAAEMIADQRVTITLLPDNAPERSALFETLAYYFVGLKPQVTALPSYARAYPGKLEQIRVELMHKTAFVGFGGQEFLNQGRAFFQNFYSNLRYLPDSYRASSLFGKFTSVPAIICAAGPSLNRNIHLLPSLRDRALIFGGGSSVVALSSRGIRPHLMSTVDPNPEQQKRMERQTAFEVPTFYKGRTYHSALQAISGPKIYLSGNNGYPITSWIEERLGIAEPELIEGYNVIHLNVEIARQMGCNPIIFVGLDLAYTDCCLYASDVVDQEKMTADALMRKTNLNNNAFERSDIFGQPTLTLWKWVAESRYLSDYATEHKETHFLNATEGGIGIEGVENVSLQSLVDSWSSPQCDFDALIRAELQEEQLPISLKELFALQKDLFTSLESCESLCQKQAEAFATMRKEIHTGRKEEAFLAQKELETLQRELEQEVAQKWILEPVNHVHSMLYEREHSKLERKMSEEEALLQRCDLHINELHSLCEVAKVSRGFLEKATEELSAEGSI